MLWIKWPEPTATRRLPKLCKRPNESCSPAFTIGGVHDSGGPWKCRSDGQRGKPKAGFPRCPQPLEIANGAISTFPPPRRRVEKWKPKSRFPSFPLVAFLSQTKTKERRPGGGSVRPRLQAHSSIRKCCRNEFSVAWTIVVALPPGRGSVCGEAALCHASCDTSPLRTLHAEPLHSYGFAGASAEDQGHARGIRESGRFSCFRARQLHHWSFDSG